MHRMVKERFKERFRRLYDLSGCSSIAEFSRRLGMKRQSVDRYYNGERCPDPSALTRICENMNVTADWLIGLSDVSSKSENIQSVVNVLHLSETAAHNLMQLADEQYDCKEPLSYFLEHEGFAQILKNYKCFYSLLHQYYKEKLYKNGIQFDTILDNGKVELDIHNAIEYYKYQMIRILERICSEEQEYLNDDEDDSLSYIDSLSQLKEMIINDREQNER